MLHSNLNPGFDADKYHTHRRGKKQTRAGARKNGTYGIYETYDTEFTFKARLSRKGAKIARKSHNSFFQW